MWFNILLYFTTLYYYLFKVLTKLQEGEFHITCEQCDKTLGHVYMEGDTARVVKLLKAELDMNVPGAGTDQSRCDFSLFHNSP
jgi:hypothetical protein